MTADTMHYPIEQEVWDLDPTQVTAIIDGDNLLIARTPEDTGPGRIIRICGCDERLALPVGHEAT
jgi:hypothetical protein